jgi:hypothetical protein
MTSKVILCIGTLCWAASVAQAQTITVTSPNGGESWAQNSGRAITWTTTGMPAGQTLQIILWQNNAKVDDIAFNVPAAGGAYQWMVGSHQTGPSVSGTGFTVRVRVPGGVLDESNASFTITPAVASLRITSPNGGQSWDVGSTRTIRWEAANLTGNVKLELLQGALVLGTIAQNIPVAALQHNWKVGEYSGGMAPVGTDYRIGITSTSSSLIDASDAPFRIALGPLAGQLPGQIHVPLVLPDLVICLRHHNDIHVPGSGTVPVRVKNVGKAASDPTRVRIHFEGDGTNHRDLPALAPGQVATVGRHEYWTLIAHKTITVEVDDDKKVVESNENNNIMTGTLHRTDDYYALEGVPFICSDGTTVQ